MILAPEFIPATLRTAALLPPLGGEPPIEELRRHVPDSPRPYVER